MKNVRNTESYLGAQLSNIHNSHVLDNIFDQFDVDKMSSYERHKNVIIYSSLESCQVSTKKVRFYSEPLLKSMVENMYIVYVEWILG